MKQDEQKKVLSQKTWENLLNKHSVLKGRVVLLENELHISSELKGDMILDDLFAQLKRRGITSFFYHQPDEFNKQYQHQTGTTAITVDSDVQKEAIKLIHEAYRQEASDIHIAYYGDYTIVEFRCLGMVHKYTQFSGDIGICIIRSIYQSLGKSGDASFSPSERQDARITERAFLPSGVHSVRIHTEPLQSTFSNDGTGTYMALRLLFDATKAEGTLENRLKSLGFTEEHQKTFRNLTQKTGLIIISGPTGHGKTTTLKQIMESMADEMPEKSYMSIEDPPEYPLMGVKQVLVSTNTKVLAEDQREAQYSATIAGLMRCDLDVCMIGEIRYKSAGRGCIEAALTGHGILSTIHASNALAIISRFREMDISLSSLCNQNVLAGLSYQRLIPLLCKECKIPLHENIKAIPSDTYFRLSRVSQKIKDVFRWNKAGCDHCKNRGLVGQTVAAEVIAVDHQILSFLRNEQLFEAQKYWIDKLGGMTHLAHALHMIDSGLIDPYLAEMRLGITLDSAGSF